MNLTRKEQKLLCLDRHFRRHPEQSHTVGDYCRILHTTVLTMLGKTEPSLRKKCEQSFKEDICKRNGLTERQFDVLLDAVKNDAEDTDKL